METYTIATHKADQQTMIRMRDTDRYKAIVLHDLWDQCIRWWQDNGRPAFQNVRLWRSDQGFDIFYYIAVDVLPGETSAPPDDPPAWRCLMEGIRYEHI